MKKKENQRILLTKRLLKESLLKLMEEKDIRKITVSELCGMAGINRSTFYNHYGCPTDVLLDIEQGIIRDLEEVCIRAEAGERCTLERRVETLCTYILKNKEMFRLFLKSSDTDSSFASSLMNAAHVRLIYDRTLSHEPCEDSRRLIATFLTNGAYFMIRQWVLEDIPKTPREMGELFRQIATQGWGDIST